MKKFLLTAVAALTATFTFAQKVTLDFTNPVEDWKLPVKANAITEATQVSNGTYTITLSAPDAAYAGGSESKGYTYLMLGKLGAALTLPEFDFAVGKIEVVGNNGASANTLMNVYVGDNAVSTETKGSTETYTYAIASDNQAVGTIYTLKINSAHNAQITKINIYELGDEPVVDPEPEDPQPEVDLVSVADAQSAAAGTEVAVQGTVVAACQNGAVIGDGTGYIFYYNTANDLTVGERVTIAGAVSAYGGFNQLTAAATVSKQGTANVTYPNVKVMTGADLDEWIAAPAISYVEYTGTLNINGNYYNVNIEGAETAVGSLIKPTAAMLEGITNGSEVVITGFAMYVSGTKYVNTVATSIKLKGEAAETVDITNTLETAYSVSKAIELIEAGKGLENKVYVKGIVSAPYKDMFIDINYGNATFFISEDGSADSLQFEIYRGYDFGGQKFTDDTKIKLGDEVVFYGTLTKYNTTYETNQGAELVLLNGMDAAANVQNITTEHAGAIYDLQGRRVQNATKGIYIINGKKVLK